jgi:hypothetical protein
MPLLIPPCKELPTSVQRIEAFFAYCRERQNIFYRREQGQDRPWSDDEILQNFKFCNIFREDDRTTIWFKDNVREPMRCDRRVVWNTVLFRMLNSIRTGKALFDAGLFHRWDADRFRKVAKNCKPLTGAAYMITTIAGIDKVEGILRIVTPVMENDQVFGMVKDQTTIESMVQCLSQFPRIGPFLGYEMALDLQHTDWFSPTDVDTWANPGPGCARGLDRVATGKLGDIAKNNVSMTATCIGMMRDLLSYSRKPEYWPSKWPAWDLNTVERALCEFDKYQRCRSAEGHPKQRYRGYGP